MPPNHLRTNPMAIDMHFIKAMQPFSNAAKQGLRAAALLASTSFAAQAQVTLCGPLENAYGPFDYRTDRSKLSIVETYHFTAEVEMLVRGRSGNIGGDLDYTLRAFPNHHRALLSTMRYGERTKLLQPPSMQYSIDCYFDRAIRFRPDDTVVRVMFAGHLRKTGRTEQAAAQLAAATEYAGDNPFSHFNIGLAYLELGRDEEARTRALQARALGFPRTELVDALKAKGKWIEPAASAPAGPVNGPGR